MTGAVRADCDYVVHGKKAAAECIGGKAVEPRLGNNVETCETKTSAGAHDDPHQWRVVHTSNKHRGAEQRGERGIDTNMTDLFECSKRVPGAEQEAGVVGGGDAAADDSWKIL